MPRSICPVKDVHRADLEAYSESSTDVPVNSYIGSVYAKFFRRLHRPPDTVILMSIDYFPILLKIRIYPQNISPLFSYERTKILALLK